MYILAHIDDRATPQMTHFGSFQSLSEALRAKVHAEQINPGMRFFVLLVVT